MRFVSRGQNLGCLDELVSDQIFGREEEVEELAEALVRLLLRLAGQALAGVGHLDTLHACWIHWQERAEEHQREISTISIKAPSFHAGRSNGTEAALPRMTMSTSPPFRDNPVARLPKSTALAPGPKALRTAALTLLSTL